MLNRVTEIFPKYLIDVVLPLGQRGPWLTIEDIGEYKFRVNILIDPPSVIKTMCQRGGDWLSLHALSLWLAHGPKIARPSEERCRAMEEVEVRLQMKDLGFPFPEIYVMLPSGRYGPYTGVLLRLDDYVLVANVTCPGHKEDISTVVRQRHEPGWTIEETLARYGEDCKDLDTEASRKALRVAISTCLTLSGTFQPALPIEYANDKKLAREKSERGERAQHRVTTALQVVSFDQTITFQRTEHSHCGVTSTGKEMPPHWRKGHWRMQVCGKGHAERKRILIAPVLVRADKFTGQKSDTSTTYK